LIFCDNPRELVAPATLEIKRTPRSLRMDDLLNLAMLICASTGAVAFTLLAAYWILRAGFALLRPKPKPAPVNSRAQAARLP
jgi:hypothetical protein